MRYFRTTHHAWEKVVLRAFVHLIMYGHGYNIMAKQHTVYKTMQSHEIHLFAQVSYVVDHKIMDVQSYMSRSTSM